MLQSNLFTQVGRDYPSGEESLNARLLIRGGFIHKSASGIYSYLPLGLRVLKKINNIVRLEMNKLGAEEMLMPTLIKKEYWQKSERWEVPIMYKLNIPSGIGGDEVGLAWTHEEVVTHIARNFISSYRDFPKSVYQIQTKFRHEARAKGGLLRGREFLMKDLYSFHANSDDLNDFYAKVTYAYKNIFNELGLTVKIVEAHGGEFTKEYTHEFQVLTSSGEDTVFYCGSCDFAKNKEIFKRENLDKCPKCGEGKIMRSQAIEVGNVFKLGTRYSEKFDLGYRDESGVKHLVVMGSYGIGQSRIMGTLAEVYGNDKGVVWPENVAPYAVHVLGLGDGRKVKDTALKLHNNLDKIGVEVLYDDRSLGAGEKFIDADMIGIPWRVVVSEKTLEKGMIEVKKRDEVNVRFMKAQDLKKILKV